MTATARRREAARRQPEMLPIRSDLTLAYRLTAALVFLLLAASAHGLMYGPRGLYDAYPAALAGLVGQDIVTLVVGLPLLIGSAWLASRGSALGLLAWAGALFYVAYSYYFFVVGGFNALFLLYVAIVAASLYGLLAVVLAIDTAALAGRLGNGLPRRRVSFLFGVIVTLFAVLWGGLSISTAAAGNELDQVPHLVVAIDGAVLLPLLSVAGIKLWRRQPWGDVLGGVLLVKVAATGLTLAFTQALGMAWAGSVDPIEAFLFAVFATMAVVAIGLLVPYARTLTEPVRGREIDVDERLTASAPMRT
jgi:hypothetical protein